MSNFSITNSAAFKSLKTQVERNKLHNSMIEHTIKVLELEQQIDLKNRQLKHSQWSRPSNITLYPNLVSRFYKSYRGYQAPTRRVYHGRLAMRHQPNSVSRCYQSYRGHQAQPRRVYHERQAMRHQPRKNLGRPIQLRRSFRKVGKNFRI